MSREHRRALVAAYKERKPRPGVFAVRCTTTGEAWVMSFTNIENRQNSLWFGLRTGTYPDRGLQAAWTAHGEATFLYEELEAIDGADLSSWQLRDRLKAREAHWRTVLETAISDG